MTDLSLRLQLTQSRTRESRLVVRTVSKLSLPATTETRDAKPVNKMSSPMIPSVCFGFTNTDRDIRMRWFYASESEVKLESSVVEVFLSKTRNCTALYETGYYRFCQCHFNPLLPLLSVSFPSIITASASVISIHYSLITESYDLCYWRRFKINHSYVN